LPRYATIEEELRQRIDHGEIRPGEPFPTEMTLCKDYGVSRHTIRRALEALERSGLIYRRQGLGTFVTRPPLVTQPLGGFYTFVDSVAEQGHEPHSVILERTVIPASSESAERLQINLNAPIVRLVRKRLADDVPLALETAEVPLTVCPDLATIDLGDESLYEFVEAHTTLLISGAAETIRPALLSREDAELLGVPVNSPAFDVQRVTSAGEQVVEWRHSLIRGDCYLYSVELPRRGVVGSLQGEPTNSSLEKTLQTSTSLASLTEDSARSDNSHQNVR